MVNYTAKDLSRINNRLSFLYEKLGGEKKGKTESKDEFVRLQNSISEDLIFLRKLIKKNRKISNDPDNYMKKKKLERDMEYKLEDIISKHNRLKTLLKSIETSNKISSEMKKNKKTVVSKLEEIIKQIERSIKEKKPEDIENQNIFQNKNHINLKDLKNGLYNKDQKNNKINFDEDYTDNGEDKEVLDEWDRKEDQLDDKLGGIINLLDEIKEMNNNLSKDIDIRDKMISDNKIEAQRVNKELEKHNKNLVELLKKYRAPSKMCLDLCLCLFIIGLISVIVMLIKNGN